MITYASYLDEERDLLSDTGVIVAFDTAITLLKRSFVFPILFTTGVDPADPGAIFVAVVGALALVVLVSWIRPERAIAELRKGTGGPGRFPRLGICGSCGYPSSPSRSSPCTSP